MTIIPKKQKSLTFQTIKNQPPMKQQAKQGSLGKWLLKWCVILKLSHSFWQVHDSLTNENLPFAPMIPMINSFLDQHY